MSFVQNLILVADVEVFEEHRGKGCGVITWIEQECLSLLAFWRRHLFGVGTGCILVCIMFATNCPVTTSAATIHWLRHVTLLITGRDARGR